jgi:hypothetical protein
MEGLLRKNMRKSFIISISMSHDKPANRTQKTQGNKYASGSIMAACSF